LTTHENAGVWEPPEGWDFKTLRHATHLCGWSHWHPAWDAGAFPIREPQISALIALTADLCRRHGIDVGPTTTLSHAEVQPTLGITQRGKWDITWLPGMIGPGDPVAVGNVLRGRVLAHMRAGS